jgi:hypothetical protein
MISPAMRSLRLRTAVNASRLPSWSRAATGVDDRNFFEVVGEIIEDGKADVVLGKRCAYCPWPISSQSAPCYIAASALNIGLHPPARKPYSEKPRRGRQDIAREQAHTAASKSVPAQSKKRPWTEHS